MKPKPFCPKGHLRTEETTYINPKTGWRTCRTCIKVNSALKRERDKADERKSMGWLKLVKV